MSDNLHKELPNKENINQDLNIVNIQSSNLHLNTSEKTQFNEQTLTFKSQNSAAGTTVHINKQSQEANALNLDQMDVSTKVQFVNGIYTSQQQIIIESIAIKSQSRVVQRPMSGKPTTDRMSLPVKLAELGQKANINSQVIDERDEFKHQLTLNQESIMHIAPMKDDKGVGMSMSYHQLSQSHTMQGQDDKTRYGIKSSYECRKDSHKKESQVRPYSAAILAIQKDMHPAMLDMDQIQSATQTHEWNDLIKQTVELDKKSRVNRVQSSKQLRDMHTLKPEDLLPEDFLKQLFFSKNSRGGEMLGSQCPNIVSTQTSNKGYNNFSRTQNNNNLSSMLSDKGKQPKPKLDRTSILWKPKNNAANSKKAVRNSQSMTSIKYMSSGFDYFENELKTPAKQKIEYYKLHNQLHQTRKGYQKMLEDQKANNERLMPIYDKEDLVQIKNGNLNVVLQFNAYTKPQSASSRVLQREKDPLNNLKRRFYKNSNKPLDDSREFDLYSKRKATTIKELNHDLKEKGLLSDEKPRRKGRKLNTKYIGDKDNSMLKSDIDINESNGVIIELEDEEGAETGNIVQQQQKLDNEYEVAKGVPSFLDSISNTHSNHSRMQTRPFSAAIQNNRTEESKGSFSQINNGNNHNDIIVEDESDSEIKIEQIVNIKTLKYSNRPMTSKLRHFQRITSGKKNNRGAPTSSSNAHFTQISTADEQSQSGMPHSQSQQNMIGSQMSIESHPQTFNQTLKKDRTQKQLHLQSYQSNTTTDSKLMSPTYQNLVFQYQTFTPQSNNLNPQNFNYNKEQLGSTQQLFEHKALKNRDIRINSNFNYKYHKNRQLIQAQANMIKQVSYTRLNPSQSTQQLQSSQNQFVNNFASNNNQPLKPQHAFQSSTNDNQQTNPSQSQNHQIMSQKVQQNNAQGLMIDSRAQKSFNQRRETPLDVINDDGGGSKEEEDEFNKQMAKAKNLKPVFTQRGNIKSTAHYRPQTAITSSSKYRGLSACSSKPSGLDTTSPQKNQNPSPRSNMMEDAGIQNSMQSNQVISVEEGQSQNFQGQEQLPNHISSSNIKVNHKQHRVLLMSQGKKSMYSLKDRAPSNDPRNLRAMTFNNPDKLHTIESLRSYAHQQDNQCNNLQEKEVIYPLKGNLRHRPISAAMNKKYLRGFYNTVDMKFGNSANLQNQQISKNQQQRAELLQFIGQDYQSLQRTSQFAVPDAIIQRQYNTSASPIRSHSPQQVQYVNDDADFMSINKEGHIQADMYQNQMEMQPNFYKPSIATLNCYVKPNSQVKMLMIGPVIDEYQ
ncbi:UNKNOWN [Stylonychia lemnae]|uniref:Uncharacterized protein n=1 Tax=Stylonychia lemnae TaxID=5949 RepID=A0A078BA79_STYLE|nr:UNKNOWN [Stylonychia lemnae]|eukprot:CDW91319.1 UNKNOWN [Stylonychia lemnae]